MIAAPAYAGSAPATNRFAAGFTGPLRTESWTAARLTAARADRAQWDLLVPLTFHSEVHGDITVPAGFTTDLASIPRAAWLYISPDDPCIEYPSVVHDWVYSNRGVLPQVGVLSDGLILTRAQADALLIEAMASCGARWDQRQIVFAAVRVGGASHWNPLPLAA